ncbi:MAG: Hsp20/alpha crystallin family protein [Nevskia sp.]|nr:Hsp20/alpha crystallin family protein [Nevskia sp.]
MNAPRRRNLLEDLERLLDRVDPKHLPAQPAHVTAQPSDWQPPTVIRETPQAYLIDIDLAGVDKQEIDLSLYEGMLSVHGRRPLPETAAGETHRGIGRLYDHFSRTFALPGDADSEAITAKMTDGVLHIRLPKTATPTARSRRIAID